MSPMEHYYRVGRYSLMAFLAAGALVAVVFLSRGPEGKVHLDGWAALLRDAGLSTGVAHFLLWAVAMVFMGCCAGGTLGHLKILDQRRKRTNDRIRDASTTAGSVESAERLFATAEHVCPNVISHESAKPTSIGRRGASGTRRTDT